MPLQVLLLALLGTPTTAALLPKHESAETEIKDTNDLGKWAVQMTTNGTKAEEARAEDLIADQSSKPTTSLPTPGSFVPLDGNIEEVIWMDSLLPFVPRKVGMAVSR